MSRASYKTMVAALAGQIREIFPWDLADQLAEQEPPLLLDIRCPHEYQDAHIAGSINVPRGILEMAADYGYEETVPQLVQARQRPIVVICRSGNRSILACDTLQQMGFVDVISLKTGLKGWNDYEQPLLDCQGRTLDFDLVDTRFSPPLRPEQLGPVTVARSQRSRNGDASSSRSKRPAGIG